MAKSHEKAVTLGSLEVGAVFWFGPVRFTKQAGSIEVDDDSLITCELEEQGLYVSIMSHALVVKDEDY